MSAVKYIEECKIKPLKQRGFYLLKVCVANFLWEYFMKKILSVFIFICLFFSCSDGGDAADSLPSVKTSDFRTDGGYTFPLQTSALQMYATLSEDYEIGEHIINATYTRTETAVLNGILHTETKTQQITRMKIYKSDTEASHLFHVDFICADESVIAFYYQWQYSNTNAWHNNKSDGEIKIN